MDGDGSLQIDKALFETASNIPDPAARREFLVTACGDNSARLSRIEDWLEVEDEAEEFFQAAARERAEVSAIAARSLAEGAEPRAALLPEDDRPGTRIDRYELLERIGEGGCGVVYLAEQLEPVRRRVALKVIRSGLDREGVIARFESERQTLALMDHPGIARVFDAGATDSGRPYFVMELVAGEKITDHCDSQRLGLRERLELFIQVCQAIQHAHQKGVIHRDIKPSNVLVSVQDGVAMPKVIDFGIARAIEGRLPDETVATAHGQLAGTPAYMSPEQAEGGRDPDTRGDVYSLGVLLHELLTGRTPLDGKRLAQAGLSEMLRILREEEPPAPSVVLARLEADELAAVAAARDSGPASWAAAVRGDLDAIITKATAKDRKERYDTVNGLATDLRRFLSDEPVSARPPGTLDLLRKLWRRHRIGFSAAAAVVVALVVGLGVASWFYLREREARQEQARLRHAAEAARANEARLLYQAKARESVSLAAMLLAEGKIEEADALLVKTPLQSIEPSMEAAGVFRALADWNAIRQRWQQAADCYLLFLQAGRVNQGQTAEGGLIVLIAIAPTLVEAGRTSEYAHFREESIARYGNTRDAVECSILLKASLLRPAGEAFLARLKPQAQALKDSIGGLDAYQGGFAALSLAMMAYRCGDFSAALEWSRQCLASPDANQARSAAAQALVAMAAQKLGQPAVAKPALEQAQTIFTGPFDRDVYFPRGQGNGHWLDWAIARVLVSEAAGLVAGNGGAAR